MAAVAGLVPCAESGIRIFLRGLPFDSMIGAHHQQAGEFAMRAGRGLQRDRVHAGDLDQAFAQRLDDAQRALRNLFRLVGMPVGQPSRRATTSFTRGLYFIVHEPSGYMPRSMA